jgi:chromate reductase, NAD(P)H dehydrogenase (quinone)
MQQPEAYVGGAAALFDDAGGVTSEATRRFFNTLTDAFAVRIEKNVSTY